MSNVKSVGELAEVGEKYHYDYYKDFDEDDSSFSYSALQPGWKDGERNFYVPKYLTGSDYSGGLVTRSNYEVFLEEFGDCEGVYSVFGSYGSYAVAIEPDIAEEDMIEMLAGLYDYPLIDEDKHSELEVEAQDEAWDDWAKADFVRAIELQLDVDGDDANDEQVFELFREATDRANIYWEDQEGSGMWIDVERAAAEVEMQEALDAGFVREDE